MICRLLVVPASICIGLPVDPLEAPLDPRPQLYIRR